MPCRYNTFDGRLLWFDGVEGKRGLTLTVFFFFFFFCCFLFWFFGCCFFFFFGVFFFFWGGGEGVKLFHCIVRTGVYGTLCA